jgi:hypothetical protein
VVYNRPYRQYYATVRHHYYAPYTNNYRTYTRINSRRNTVASNGRRSDRYIQDNTRRSSTRRSNVVSQNNTVRRGDRISTSTNKRRVVSDRGTTQKRRIESNTQKTKS